MKRLIILAIVIVSLLFSSMNNNLLFDLFEQNTSGEVVFYCSELEDVDLKNEQNGEAFIYRTTGEKAGDVFKKLHSCYGVEMTLSNPDSLNYFFNKITIVKIEKIENIAITYAFSENIMFNGFVNNQKCNIQIAESEHSIKIGFPIIFSSF